MNIASILQQSAQADIEAGGLWWRVRKITSADMVEAGRPMFVAAHVDLRASDAAAQMVAESLKEPGKVVEGMRFLEAVAVAGLVAASQDGQAWEALRLVLDVRQEEPGASRLHVGSLPPGVVEAIAAKVLYLTTDGGAASERLGSFRARDGARP